MSTWLLLAGMIFIKLFLALFLFVAGFMFLGAATLGEKNLAGWLVESWPARMFTAAVGTLGIVTAFRLLFDW